jgi:hypothetical protein
MAQGKTILTDRAHDRYLVAFAGVDGFGTGALDWDQLSFSFDGIAGL